MPINHTEIFLLFRYGSQDREPYATNQKATRIAPCARNTVNGGKPQRARSIAQTINRSFSLNSANNQLNYSEGSAGAFPSKSVLINHKAALVSDCVNPVTIKPPSKVDETE
jgi:hypothetical protein